MGEYRTRTKECGVCVGDRGWWRRQTGQRPKSVVYVWMSGEVGGGRPGDD